MTIAVAATRAQFVTTLVDTVVYVIHGVTYGCDFKAFHKNVHKSAQRCHTLGIQKQMSFSFSFILNFRLPSWGCSSYSSIAVFLCRCHEGSCCGTILFHLPEVLRHIQHCHQGLKQMPRMSITHVARLGRRDTSRCYSIH